MYNTQWHKACRAGFAAFIVFSFLGQLAESQVPQKKCAEVNEYCQNHWDCCSNSCMSFLYRCTRGTGIPPAHLKPNFPPMGVQFQEYPPSHSTANTQIVQRFGDSSTKPNEVIPPKKCTPYNEYCQNHWDCCSNSCMSYVYRCTLGAGVMPPHLEHVVPTFNGNYKDLVAMVFGGQSVANAGDSNTASSTPAFAIDQRFDGSPSKTTRTTTTTQHPTTTISQSSSTDALDEYTTTTQNEYETNTNAIDQTSAKANNTTATVSNAAPGATDSCKQIGELCYRNDECCTKMCPSYLSRCVT